MSVSKEGIRQETFGAEIKNSIIEYSNIKPIPKDLTLFLDIIISNHWNIIQLLKNSHWTPIRCN